MSEEPRQKWERWSTEFRERALERMKTCKNVGALAKELGAARQLLYVWNQEADGRRKLRKAALVQIESWRNFGQPRLFDSERLRLGSQRSPPDFRHRRRASAELAGFELALLDLLRQFDPSDHHCCGSETL